MKVKDLLTTLEKLPDDHVVGVELNEQEEGKTVLKDSKIRADLLRMTLGACNPDSEVKGNIRLYALETKLFNALEK